MRILGERIDKILGRVHKPTRYLGGEWNSSVRPWEEADVHLALAYPDVYEVGQSHLGLRILYGLVNETPGLHAERVYAPWPDMEEEMRREGIPLFTLESRRPVREFELIGISLQYELTYSNILNMLSLAGLRLRAAERGGAWPLVLGGGPGAFNPEPLADFFDLFFLGEAEEGLLELMDAIRAERLRGVSGPALLRHLAGLPGVYVPSLYGVRYHGDGTVASITPAPGAPFPVTKRTVADLDRAYYPGCFVVPHQEIVHDRGMLEILRGCTHGCRFCQAGMVYRPVRERTLPILQAQATALLRSTGFEEISLTSLSSTDHSRLQELLESILHQHAPHGVNVSLPSLRADRFSIALAERMQGARKGSLTFAPEAGSERLRRIINKDLTEARIIETAEAAFGSGWQRLKLYFMIGLPGEEDDDLLALAELARRIRAIGLRFTARASVTVSISTFVPKAHTPFQWRAQLGLDETKARQAKLQGLIRGRGFQLQWHQAEQSFLEGVFARGDRRLGGALEAAHRLGCRFDGWHEWFDYAAWVRAFAAAGVDPAFYTTRGRSYDEVLPWEHLSAGVSRSYLRIEDERAANGDRTADCRRHRCGGCGVCPSLGFAPHEAGR